MGLLMTNRSPEFRDSEAGKPYGTFLLVRSPKSRGALYLPGSI